MPLLGRAFIGLSGLDVAARILNVTGFGLSLDPGNVLGPLLIVPHEALILLPAVILARRPDAIATTPTLLAGAAVLAVLELVGRPLLVVLFPGTGDPTGWLVVHLIAWLLRAWGFALLAIGLAALARQEPSPRLRDGANAVAGIGIAAIITEIVLAARTQPGDGEPSGVGALVLIVGVVSELATLSQVYLGRVIVRGTLAAGRPRRATMLASAAIVIGALGSLIALLAYVTALFQLASGTSEVLAAGAFGPAIFGVAGPFVVVGLVTAFGFGLGDAPRQRPRRVPSGREPTRKER